MSNNLNITFDQFRGHVNDLCRKIVVSNWRPDYIVGITRGGLFPAVMISHFFKVPMHSLDVSLRDNQNALESNTWMAEDALGYVPTEQYPNYNARFDPSLRKNILIVDDINDTGNTLNWIKGDWQASCLPNEPVWENIWGQSTRVAVVVDNLSSRCRVPINYSAVEVNKAEDNVWVDFPYEKWWK